MARTPLLPQHLIQPLFDVYPDLPPAIQLIHPGITEEELQSPKDPVKFFLLSHLLIAAFKHENIQNIMTTPENLQNFMFDIELSDFLLAQTQATSTGVQSQAITVFNFQEYIEQLHQQESQKNQDLINDECILKTLSHDLENNLKTHRKILHQNACALNLEFDEEDVQRLFRIYDELRKKTYNPKATGLNQFSTEQAASLAEHLLNPNSELAKICQTALKDLASLKESFYNQIIIKYLKRFIYRHERILELSQKNQTKTSIMTWISRAFFPCEDREPPHPNLPPEGEGT